MAQARQQLPEAHNDASASSSKSKDQIKHNARQTATKPKHASCDYMARYVTDSWRVPEWLTPSIITSQ
eukprot:scaffold289202_cov37-Prasinocladus_malaysianus.AAC.2